MTFELGDAVKVKHFGVDMYGTLQWQGVFPNGVNMAGIEMVSVVRYTAVDICKVALTCSDLHRSQYPLLLISF